MAAELKEYVINMKSLDQDIQDPVIIGDGEINGTTLSIIFTQEAAAQITPNTKVYLKWKHQQLDVIGYNVFDKISDEPPIWKIYYPQSLLYEGSVIATIELVDDIGIATSVPFHIHVLRDPYDSDRFSASDDYTEFQRAAMDLVNAKKDAEAAAHAATEAAAQAIDAANYVISQMLEIVEF